MIPSSEAMNILKQLLRLEVDIWHMCAKCLCCKLSFLRRCVQFDGGYVDLNKGLCRFEQIEVFRSTRQYHILYIFSYLFSSDSQIRVSLGFHPLDYKKTAACFLIEDYSNQEKEVAT